MKLVEKMQKSLIAYVHTPKAAGSTVNDALAKLGPGLDHIERFEGQEENFKSELSDKIWVSGHVTIDKLEEMLSDVKRPIRYFSSIRRPVDQVKSHYNWLIEIYYKGEDFYNDHPPIIKKISEEIRSSNRSDVDKIIKILEKYSDLFLNFQSRYVLGEGNDVDEEAIAYNIRKYEYVSLPEDLGGMFDRMSKGLSYNKKSNVSRYHFDPSIFGSEKMKNFLAEHNAVDNKLYDVVYKMKESERKGVSKSLGSGPLSWFFRKNIKRHR